MPININFQRYYWHRESRNSQAEVDYVIQKNEDLIPIEVKAGKSRAMKSIHLFITEKKQNTGIRIAIENFSEFKKIKVLPLYAVGNLF